MYRAVNQRFADVVVEEADVREPDRAGAGLSFRAAAAHDPQRPAQGDHRHLLAHSLAQRRNLLDLPVAGGNPRRPARLARSSAFTPSSTATISSIPSTASSKAGSTAKTSSVALRRTGDAGAALSDLHRMAAARLCRTSPRSSSAASTCANASAFAPDMRIARRRRALRLHQGHSRPHARRRRPARRCRRNGAANSC